MYTRLEYICAVLALTLPATYSTANDSDFDSSFDIDVEGNARAWRWGSAW